MAPKVLLDAKRPSGSTRSGGRSLGLRLARSVRRWPRKLARNPAQNLVRNGEKRQRRSLAKSAAGLRGKSGGRRADFIVSEVYFWSGTCGKGWFSFPRGPGGAGCLQVEIWGRGA